MASQVGPQASYYRLQFSMNQNHHTERENLEKKNYGFSHTCLPYNFLKQILIAC
jgi:hypothetical protein